MIRLVLWLEEREAEALLTVCRSIGGDLDGPRSVTQGITRALEHIDVRAQDKEVYIKEGIIHMQTHWPGGKRDKPLAEATRY